MAKVAVALGSNIGDRAANLEAGREGVASRGVRWTAVSSIYETVPMGPVTDQGAFLNQVAVGETCLPPHALLKVCLAVEKDRGRVRAARGGPRTLDLDILLYEEQRIQEPDLVVPHPEMARRAFVLVPLAEVAPDWRVPDWRVPDEERTVRELLRAAPGREGVHVWRSSATRPPM